MKSAAPPAAAAAAARPDGRCAQRQRQHNRANAPHMPPHKNPQKCSIFDAQQYASKYGTSTRMLRKRRKNLPDARPRLKIARLPPSRCRTYSGSVMFFRVGPLHKGQPSKGDNE
jgi:hypothetical protein